MCITKCMILDSGGSDSVSCPDPGPPVYSLWFKPSVLVNRALIPVCRLLLAWVVGLLFAVPSPTFPWVTKELYIEVPTLVLVHIPLHSKCGLAGAKECPRPGGFRPLVHEIAYTSINMLYLSYGCFLPHLTRGNLEKTWLRIETRNKQKERNLEAPRCSDFGCEVMPIQSGQAGATTKWKVLARPLMHCSQAAPGG